MKKWSWFILSLVVVLLDQASKLWMESILIPYKPVSIIPMLNLTLAYNTGAAFSFLSGTGGWHRWFFAGFSLIFSLILFIWLSRIPAKARCQALGLSLILGGAVGNLIDRALDGYVVDFIDVYYSYHHFATFNLADSAISIGAFALIMDVLFSKESN